MDTRMILALAIFIGSYELATGQTQQDSQQPEPRYGVLYQPPRSVPDQRPTQQAPQGWKPDNRSAELITDQPQVQAPNRQRTNRAEIPLPERRSVERAERPAKRRDVIEPKPTIQPQPGITIQPHPGQHSRRPSGYHNLLYPLISSAAGLIPAILFMHAAQRACL